MKGSEKANMLFSGAVMEKLGHEKYNKSWPHSDLFISVLFVEAAYGSMIVT